LTLDSKYTFDDHVSRSNDVWANFKYHLTLKILNRKFGVGSRSRVYDLGCGSGYFCSKLSRLGFEVIGVEPDPEAYALASASYQSIGASFLNLPIDKINIESDADVIIMHDVLEHIDAEHATLLSVAALLKDPGLLIISVPASELLFGHHDRQLGHFRRYSKSSLRRALNPLFHIHSIRYIGASGIVPILLFSRLLKTSYPVSSQASIPLSQRIFGWLLHVEWFLHLPFGGGLIVVATKRVRPSVV
jgi:SAM-dependent methyltransferase